MIKEASNAIAAVEGKTIAQLIRETIPFHLIAPPFIISDMNKRLVKEMDIKFVDDANLETILKDLAQPLFNLFGRPDNVVKIMDDDKPNAMNMHGAGVMISRGLLNRIKDNGELLGIIAHELAHNLFMFQSMQAQGNPRSNWKNELMCDAVSAVALMEIGVNPIHSANAHKNMPPDYLVMNMLLTRFRPEKTSHPPVDDRIELFEHFAAKFKS